MKVAVYIDNDETVCIILYAKQTEPVRKIWVFPDGKISFRDFGDSRKGQEYVLLAPLEVKENESSNS